MFWALHCVHSNTHEEAPTTLTGFGNAGILAPEKPEAAGCFQQDAQNGCETGPKIVALTGTFPVKLLL